MSEHAEALRAIVAREAGVPWAELAAVLRAIGDDAEMNRRMKAEFFSGPTGTQADLCRYYRESRTWLMQTYGNGHGALERLASGERPEISGWGAEFVRMLPPSGASVLDYGGGFLKDSWFFVPRGHRVALAEVEGPVTRIVGAFLRERGIQGVSIVEVRDGDPDLGRHDGAVCFETLEHVRDPVGLARRIASSVAPGGPIALSVSFGAPDHAPYHLAENARLSDPAAWEAELVRMGLEPLPWRDASSVRLWRKRA